MKYRVHELKLAEADVCGIVDWISQRSPLGAEAWLDAYDEMIDGLRQFVGMPLRQRMLPSTSRSSRFSSRRDTGIYRALYFVEGEAVYVLRVRGKGQTEVRPGELGRP